VLLALILLLIVFCFGAALMAAHGKSGLYAHSKIGRAGKPVSSVENQDNGTHAQAALPRFFRATLDARRWEWPLYTS